MSLDFQCEADEIIAFIDLLRGAPPGGRGGATAEDQQYKTKERNVSCHHECSIEQLAMPERSIVECSVVDGILRCWTDLYTDAAASTGLRRDSGTVCLVQRDGPLYRTLVDTERAWLALPCKAGELVNLRVGHLEWKLVTQYPGLAGGNAWCIGTHHTGLSYWINEWCASSFLACFGGRPSDGLWWTGSDALSAPCT